MKAAIAMSLLLVSAPVAAQTPTPPVSPQEMSPIHDAFSKEKERLGKACGAGGFKAIGSCAAGLATEHPLHIAFGSLAPQSGFAVGGALVGHKNFTTKPLRLYWSGDGVVAAGGSWRTGLYFNFDHVNESLPGIGTGSSTSPDANRPSVKAVYSAFVQATSLKKLLFFGLGPDSLEAGESRWAFAETIIGGKVYKPIASGSANLDVIGAITGRFTEVRGNTSEPGRSIDDLYDAVTAPGLGVRTASFLQFTETARAQPSWFGRYVYPFYSVSFDQFVSDEAAQASFNRMTVDLTHEFPLYRTSRSVRSGTSDLVGPNQCSESGPCASISRNRDGAIILRVVTTASWARTNQAVPYYLQPTLGGSDLNGNAVMNGFSDYRFRAPNLIAVQESFNHSLGFWEPLGVIVMAEQGKVTLDRGDLNFAGLEHSVTAGLTIRAGGFPQVFITFAWTSEGHHIGVRINQSLLGGGSRPSLF